ncbi:hypothetical protein GCM10027605_00590 [Micromonospora zhanjiangensis]
MCWRVEVAAPDLPAYRVNSPHQPSLAAAVAYCLEFLELALAASVPANPHQPIPVPQTPFPRPVAAPGELIARLAHHFPGELLTVRVDRSGCALHRHDDDGAHLLASAPDLPAAIALLDLTPA